MSSTVHFLITLLDEKNKHLTKTVLTVVDVNEHGDMGDYPMEPENRERLHKLLPDSVSSIGPIVDVDTSIYEVSVST